MAAYGFTFNGTHSSAHGLAVRSVNRQLLPDPDDQYLQIPGRSGSFLFPKGYKDREIALRCAFLGSSIPDTRSKARSLAAWLSTSERAVLAFDDEPGKYYLGKLSEKVNLESLFVMGQFSLLFRCEPFAYAAEQTDNFAGDAVTVSSAGTVAAPAIIEATLTGSASEWKVTLGTKFIRLVDTFTAGDTIKIDTETNEILVNGSRAANLLDWQQSRFFELQPGENSLAITPAGICTASIKHSARWL